jgi:hypothetical protein
MQNQSTEYQRNACAAQNFEFTGDMIIGRASITQKLYFSCKHKH